MTSPTNHYIFETFTDRERLYAQFEMSKENFNQKFREALVKGQLSTDPVIANWRFLDAGCGEGLFSGEVLDNYPKIEVVGFDRDAEAVTTANMFVTPRGNAHFFVHNVLDPLPSHVQVGDGDVNTEGFDVIMAWYVLMHTKPAEKALANLIAVLKPGGVLIINDSVSKWATFPHPSFEFLVNTMSTAGSRFASFDFAERHTEILQQLGMVDIDSNLSGQPMGGKTQAGQKVFAHVVSTIEAARTGLVERMQAISAAEFDEHLRRVKTEATTDQEGRGQSVITIARKPVDSK